MPPHPDSVTRTWGKTILVDAGETVEDFMSRLWVMVILFSVSLFASSFPTLSKRISYLRIPQILFFLGKHFGTGVILSTAFVHLLQDAFKNLDHPIVKERWSVGNYTGLIVLGSLLSLFLVEYISTAYVDRLQSYSSPSPTPPTSSPSSREPSIIQLLTAEPDETPHSEPGVHTEEATPLIQSGTNANLPVPPSYRSTEGSQSQSNHHHHHHSHPSNISRHPSSLSTAVPQADSADQTFFSGGHHRHETRSIHASHTGIGPGRRGSLIKFSKIDGESEGEDDKVAVVASHLHLHRPHSHDREHPPGPRHSHSHSRDSEHSHGHGHSHGHHHLGMEDWDPNATDDEVIVGHKRQVVGILMLQLGIMIHSLVIGLTLAITSGPEFTTLLTAIIFHQLFEGLSLGIRIASLPSSNEGGFICLPEPVLKTVLVFTFAMTTPVGIALGLGLFGGGRSAGAHLKLIQGLMCALSAGMLIYAACVEMLAADFVMDPLLWRSSIKKQVMALTSLLLGVACMAIIGMWD